MTLSENNSAHDFWQLHIKQWQASGLSQAEYCRQQALVIHQFTYWKHKFLADQDAVELNPKAGFTRVQIATPMIPPISPGLSLYFRDGTQLMGIAPHHNLDFIKELIEVLR